MSSRADDSTVSLKAGARTPGAGAAAAAVPKRIGRYEILQVLGRGAMGVVYKARDPRIDREVALKVIPLAKEFEGSELEQARSKFFREAQAAGRLSHPHIVTIFDAGGDEESAYIAMEMLRGRHLVEYTSPSRLLPAPLVIEIGARLASALHYAHQNGVVHRDIKPGNIIFDPSSGELKITDFGIARITDSSRTRTGVVMGTPSFMAPEQLQGKPLTGRSDLFSLAVTLFQLLVGQLPFRADTMPGLMVKIAQEPHPRICAVRPDLPPSLDAFFDRALAKNPDDRFATGAAMAQALRDLNPRRTE
jgi:serine/threonine-protein kinase